MCAGVQNVSRPIVRCHEMSHRMPMQIDVPPATTAQTYHETFPAAATRAGAPCAWALGASATRLGAAAIELALVFTLPHINRIRINPWPQLTIELQPRFQAVFDRLGHLFGNRVCIILVLNRLIAQLFGM